MIKNFQPLKNIFLRKENIHLQKCSCGKKYKSWINIYLIPEHREKNKIVKEKIAKLGVVYPENSCHCDCRLKWGEHYPDLLNREIYKNYVKDKCVNDQNVLPGTIEYYEKNGNFCFECNRKIIILEQERIDETKRIKKEIKEELGKKKIEIEKRE